MTVIILNSINSTTQLLQLVMIPKETGSSEIHGAHVGVRKVI